MTPHIPDHIIEAFRQIQNHLLNAEIPYAMTLCYNVHVEDKDKSDIIQENNAETRLLKAVSSKHFENFETLSQQNKDA